jgi:hypothetical protein
LLLLFHFWALLACRLADTSEINARHTSQMATIESPHSENVAIVRAAATDGTLGQRLVGVNHAYLQTPRQLVDVNRKLVINF